MYIKTALALTYLIYLKQLNSIMLGTASLDKPAPLPLLGSLRTRVPPPGIKSPFLCAMYGVKTLQETCSK